MASVAAADEAYLTTVDASAATAIRLITPIVTSAVIAASVAELAVLA